MCVPVCATVPHVHGCYTVGSVGVCIQGRQRASGEGHGVADLELPLSEPASMLVMDCTGCTVYCVLCMCTVELCVAYVCEPLLLCVCAAARCKCVLLSESPVCQCVCVSHCVRGCVGALMPCPVCVSPAVCARVSGAECALMFHWGWFATHVCGDTCVAWTTLGKGDPHGSGAPRADHDRL